MPEAEKLVRLELSTHEQGGGKDSVTIGCNGLKSVLAKDSEQPCRLSGFIFGSTATGSRRIEGSTRDT